MVVSWLELIVWLYFFYVTAYTFLFSTFAFLYRNPKGVSAKKGKFAVFIPSYNEDAVIVGVASHALKQTYPSSQYRVFVIADSLQPQTVQALQGLPITVIPVVFEQSTKVKSIVYAIGQITDHYDYAVILDADNMMEPQFLEKMNNALGSGRHAVQGQRKPKNAENTMAFLDGLSESINNHIYRQGHTALGLSSSISGSGIAFDYPVFKSLITTMTSVGGFDRELELLLLERGISVVYYKDSAVLDEKVQKTAVFANQRKRWISSQYHYLAKYFWKGTAGLLRGQFSYFNSSVLRNIQLPRLLNMGLITVLTAALFFVRDYLLFGFWPWLALFVVLMFSIAIAIPRDAYKKDFWLALLMLPGLFLKMLLLLFRLKGANKKFIHTPHGAAAK
jgi:cellulose synthase/poly-beta-1,6-N-acetylglucosamine synthase-like glycosyltransferase